MPATDPSHLQAARIEELEEQVAGLEAELKANEELSAKNQEEFATNISAVRAELGESLAAETSKATAAQVCPPAFLCSGEDADACVHDGSMRSGALVCHAAVPL